MEKEPKYYRQTKIVVTLGPADLPPWVVPTQDRVCFSLVPAISCSGGVAEAE